MIKFLYKRDVTCSWPPLSPVTNCHTFSDPHPPRAWRTLWTAPYLDEEKTGKITDIHCLKLRLSQTAQNLKNGKCLLAPPIAYRSVTFQSQLVSLGLCARHHQGRSHLCNLSIYYTIFDILGAA